ncbi:hypothetical protein DRJ19_01835 [Candidatus Woesearchaeota archaeon]|nr:MAG: hypothetical protein DRJ19_01835 [Candidatus Woesearchaeota archaeon]
MSRRNKEAKMMDLSLTEIFQKGEKFIEELEKRQKRRIEELKAKYGNENVIVSPTSPGPEWKRVDNYYDLVNWTVLGVWVKPPTPVSATEQIVSFLSNPVVITAVGIYIVWRLLRR